MSTATANFVLSKGYDVSGAIKARTFVKWNAEETVMGIATADDLYLTVPVGVAMFDVVTTAPFVGMLTDAQRGKGASVAVMGAAEVWCDGAIPVGSPVSISSTAGKEGYAKVAATGTRVVGYARGSGIDGGLCSVQLDLPGSKL